MRKPAELSRAQVVRKRRTQQGERRVTRSSALARRPMAPITSRGMQPFADAQGITSPAVRRQYQAAISMPGIEVRMPAISFTSRSLKWRVVSTVLSAALIGILYLAWTSSFFRVTAPQVSGNVRNSAEEIGASLQAASEPSFMLVPADLERRLRLNFPDILSARVQVAFPNNLTIQLVERQPLIAWQQGNGYTWIDDQGIAFRPQGSADNLIAVSSQEAPPRGLPSLTDPVAPIPYLTADMVNAIRQLASKVPAGETMLYDPKYGLGWADTRGWRVFFGTNNRDLPARLKVYEAVVASLTTKGVAPAFISVQYANAPYYRMSQ